MTKIVNFISGKDLGGPKQSFLLYSEALSKLGYKVDSLVRAGAPLVSILELMGLPVYEVAYIRSANPLLRSIAVGKLQESLAPLRPDIIFVHKQVDIGLVRSAVGDTVKIIGIVHGFNSKGVEPADVLIAVSRKVKEFLLSADYKKPIAVIPNMVKIGSEPTYRDLPDVPLIGAMGIFRRKKGFHLLIHALRVLKDRGVRFRAVIAGRGQLYLYLKFLRWRLGLKNELEFRGWVSNEERDGFLDQLDIFVLPSRTESFGMVVVEAMARMKRVIATRCGGPEEIISDGENGYLVGKSDHYKIADGLERVILSKKERAVVEAAYSRALQQYDIDSVSARIERVVALMN